MEIDAFEELSDVVLDSPQAILAIDPGWKLGYAVFEGDLFLEYGTMDFQKEVGERGRFDALRNFLWHLLMRHSVQILLIEPPFGRWRSVRNGEICGAIKIYVYAWGIVIKEMNARSVRSRLGVKNGKEALAYAQDWMRNKKLTQHEADAISMVLAHLKEEK